MGAEDLAATGDHEDVIDAETGSQSPDGPNLQRPSTQPYALGAGLLILVARELTGLSQRKLARRCGIAQPTLATLETGNRIPTVRTLLKIADASGFHLVLGLRRTDAPLGDPQAYNELGCALVGTLHHNAEDDLADFLVLREPSPLEGVP